MMKAPKSSRKEDVVDPEAEVKAELKEANLGCTTISIDCLEISQHQVRPIAQWLVDDIAASMLQYTDESYQPLVVLTKNLPRNKAWTSDMANGLSYEVVGGQHNLMACRKVLADNPDQDILKSRRCQVYRGEELSYQAKAYIGVRNNQIAENRRTDTPKEKLMLCRDMYVHRRQDNDSWKMLCKSMIKVKNSRDYRTLFTMVQKEEELYLKYEKVFDKNEKGQLKGQGGKGNDEFPLYLFRKAGALTNDCCRELLDMVLDGIIKLGEVKLTAKNSQKLQQVQAALMGEIDQTCEITWGEMEQRFPENIKRELLLNLFGNIDFTNMKNPPPLVEHAKECLRWEKNQQIECGSIKGKGGCIGRLLQVDARKMTRQHMKDACMSVPHFQLAVLDKPQDMNIEDLTAVVISYTALVRQDPLNAVLAIVCTPVEMAAVVEMLEGRNFFSNVHNCYYHIPTKQAGANTLTQSVYGLVVASRDQLTSWKWSGNGNFISIPADSTYLDADGTVVDQRQKPVQLYKEIICAATQEHQWVLDICCGTGTGLIAALQLTRNCVAVDKSEDMLSHCKGRMNKQYQPEEEEEETEIEEENEDEETSADI